MSSASMIIKLALLCSILLPAQTLFKRWHSNTDFDNPSNWDVGHLPCPNDRIVFPYSAPVVAINQDWTLKEIVLPVDGVIILGDNINLVFNSNPTISGQCQEPKDVTYNYTQASHWLDPTKWCLPMHDFDDICFENVLQLHTEMVPCQMDDVIFSGLIRASHRSSFYVNLDMGDDMYLKSLRVGQQYFSTEGFIDYITNTTIGRREFVRGPGLNPPILNITDRLCVDPAGCYCGTNTSPYKQKICAYVTCPATNCPSPFTPEGHCCAICGSRLVLDINATAYNEFTMKELVKKEFIENKGRNLSDVLLAVSRQSNGDSQLTLVDKAAGQEASNVAAELRSQLESDSQMAQNFGVLSVKRMDTSQTPLTTLPASVSTQTKPTTPVTNPSSTTPGSPTPSAQSTASTSRQTTKGTPGITISRPSTSSYSTSAGISSSQVTVSTSPLTTLGTSKPLTMSTEHSTTHTASSSRVTNTASATPSTNEPSDQGQAGQRTGESNSDDDSASQVNVGLIVGSTLLAVLVLLLVMLGIGCYLAPGRQPSSPDPLAVSMRFDDGGNGNVVFSGGMDNPTYDYNLNEPDLGDIPMSSISAMGPNGVTNIRTSTKRKDKKKLQHKKSTGFDNPMFFDVKTDTIGSVEGNSSAASRPGVENPLYDDEDLGTSASTSASFDESFP